MAEVNFNSFGGMRSFPKQGEPFNSLKEDYKIIAALALSKLREIKENNLDAIKISRHSIEQLSNSYTILRDGSILRHFHSRTKQGEEIQPKSEGLLINADEVHFKKPKKMYSFQGCISHVLSIFTEGFDEESKKYAIAIANQMMIEFSQTPSILKSYCLKWKTRGGKEAECLISRYAGSDSFVFFKNLPERFDFSSLIEVFLSMSRLIKAMHDKDWAHFDIKPENFLIEEGENDSYNVSLIDFDFSLGLEEDVAISVRGTDGFIAPELVLNRCCGIVSGKKADIYSLGKTFKDLIGKFYDKTGNVIIGSPLLKLSKEMHMHTALSRPSIEEVIDELINLRIGC
jgi:serine/threonine protein kinase